MLHLCDERNTVIFVVYLREESHVILLTDYALLALKGGEYAMIDIEDAERVERYEWAVHRLMNGQRYVRQARANGIRLHRFILGATDIPVDHVNGDTMDNRRANLRRCSQANNIRNGQKQRYGKCASRGVARARGRKFVARIMFNGEHIFIGSYETEELASKAYRAKAKELFGAFASQEIL